jgi:hypothetical protein
MRASIRCHLVELFRTTVSYDPARVLQLTADLFKGFNMGVQARLVAAVLLEARDRMDVQLPPEAEGAPTKDARESAEAAATPARSAGLSARVKWR